jgi:hypothetical protein
MKQRPGVRFVTASELPALYAGPTETAVDRKTAAERLRDHLLFTEIGGRTYSPADLLLSLLEVSPRVVDGPTATGKTTYTKPSIPAAAFHRTTADAADFVRRFGRLPNEVWIGAESLSLPDFAATLAASFGRSGDVAVIKGTTDFDRYFATDGKKSFNWVIHAEGFDGSTLLELGRLQGWTLKPAHLR